MASRVRYPQYGPNAGGADRPAKRTREAHFQHSRVICPIRMSMAKDARSMFNSRASMLRVRRGRRSAQVNSIVNSLGL